MSWGWVCGEGYEVTSPDGWLDGMRMHCYTAEELIQILGGARVGEDGPMVFCKLCKHYKRVDYENRAQVECHAEGEEDHDWCRVWTVWKNPRNKNANNDCPDFEPSRLVRLTWWVKGVWG